LFGSIESDQQENIRRYRAAQDEADRARLDVKAEGAEGIAHLNQYHKCIKVLHLTGQVLRSFPGMLPRALKLRAARGVVTLSLRALTDFASTLRTSRTELRAAIVDFLVTTRPSLNAQTAMERADKAIFYLALGAGHGLLRRATLALGSTHILPTLDVLRTDRIGPGFEMIDLAVRLDFARDRASVKDALAVKDRVSSSGFALFVLRQLVMDFLMTFRLPTGVRAKFISGFDLDTTKRLVPARAEMIATALDDAPKK
jgi:hypothetical protein